jgi:sRNA-binding regulator protein Hfq
MSQQVVHNAGYKDSKVSIYLRNGFQIDQESHLFLAEKSFLSI